MSARHTLPTISIVRTRRSTPRRNANSSSTQKLSDKLLQIKRLNSLAIAAVGTCRRDFRWTRTILLHNSKHNFAPRDCELFETVRTDSASKSAL